MRIHSPSRMGERKSDRPYWLSSYLATGGEMARPARAKVRPAYAGGASREVNSTEGALEGTWSTEGKACAQGCRDAHDRLEARAMRELSQSSHCRLSGELTPLNFRL